MARGIAEGQERRGCGVGALVAARRASWRVGPSIPHGRSPGPLPRIHATPAPPRGGISAPQKPTPESQPEGGRFRPPKWHSGLIYPYYRRSVMSETDYTLSPLGFTKTTCIPVMSLALS